MTLNETLDHLEAPEYIVADYPVARCEVCGALSPEYPSIPDLDAFVEEHLRHEFEDYEERYPGEDMDGDFDSAMASAGFGTDEDYGYFGPDGEDF